MLKLIYSIYKEYKVLIRDKAGLGILFLMPMALIFIVTLLQDGTFKSVNESQVPLLLVDNDQDSLGQKIEAALVHSKFFTVEKRNMSAEEAKNIIASGKYLIGLVVPENSSKHLRERSSQQVENMLAGMTGQEVKPKEHQDSLQVKVLFDPIAKESFKATISNAVKGIISEIEMKEMVNAFSKQLSEVFPENKPRPVQLSPIITIHQEYASSGNSMIIPNSVQHNIPAWTLFAMFFIVIPLAGNMIKEREDGSAFRLLTMPGSYLTVMLGKMITFLIVCSLQFFLMLAVGRYIMPMIGLPTLIIGSNIFTLFIVAIACGMAATSFGLLVGTIATTHEQAATFGAVSSVILAAIGGVWVPVFVMPDIMKHISVISPMNWGLNAFYDVFLRNAGIATVMPEVLKLLVFFGACLSVAFVWQKSRRI